MPRDEPGFIPVLHRGILLTGGLAGPLEVRLDGIPAEAFDTGGALALAIPPESDCLLDLRRGGVSLPGLPMQVQIGGWKGKVDWQRGGLVAGHARNQRHPAEDAVVVAFDATGPRAFATARASADGAFLMRLPTGVGTLRFGIAGSDTLLDGGVLRMPKASVRACSTAPTAEPFGSIRLKISAPNLRDAPAWGDYHFARSLQAAFERQGRVVGVDTVDGWYGHSGHEDVVIALRGRRRLRVDRSKINILWLISHPDRIEPDEYDDYDHVAVASDIYAAELIRQGLPSVSVLHQATDPALFCPQPGVPRLPACLFVGNSRNEYRTMVKWCLQARIPLELYGGGWDGVVAPDLVRARLIANADLPAVYARHLILLNDHWDSMRENGFLSNRLFDGSAVGTPILTDAVQGLDAVFGDAIAVADSRESMEALVAEGLADPARWLNRAARAREIVLGAHTFDHRAAELTGIVARIAGQS